MQFNTVNTKFPNGLAFPSGSVDPSTDVVAGNVFFNTSVNKPKYFDGSIWSEIGGSVSLSGTAPIIYSGGVISLSPTISQATTFNAATARGVVVDRPIGNASGFGIQRSGVNKLAMLVGTDENAYIQMYAAGTGSGLGQAIAFDGTVGNAFFPMKPTMTAATTATASLNLPPATGTPSAPVNGDMWNNTTGLFMRINGTTRQYANLDQSQTLTNKLFTSGNTWQGNVIGTQYGGTGLAAIGIAGQSIRVNAGATALEYYTPSTSTGTVTSFAFTNGGGFTGVVTNASTTPTLSLTYTGNGFIQNQSTPTQTADFNISGTGTAATFSATNIGASNTITSTNLQVSGGSVRIGPNTISTNSSFVQLFDTTGLFGFSNHTSNSVGTVAFDLSLVTGNRIYKYQNTSGTIALLEAANIWTGANTFNTGLIIFNTAPLFNNGLVTLTGMKFQDSGTGNGISIIQTAATTNKTQFLQDKSGTIALLSDVQGTSQVLTADSAIVPGIRYYVNPATNITLNLTLPATFNMDDLFLIFGKTGTFKIVQNTGQQIKSVQYNTTSGSTGSLTSTNQYCTLTLRGLTANTELLVTTQQGTFTPV